jgi:hypothetical protein
MLHLLVYHSCTFRTIPFGRGEEEFLHWYNPETRVAETVSAPCTDEEASQMLSGGPDSGAFVAEYGRLRGDGMPAEQAMIFVGHRFRMRHLGHLPLGYQLG